MLEVPFKNKKESFFYFKNKLTNPEKIIDELISGVTELLLTTNDVCNYENKILLPICKKHELKLSQSNYCRCDYDDEKYLKCVCDYCDDCNDCNFKTQISRIRVWVKTDKGCKVFETRKEFKKWLEQKIKCENPYIEELKAKKITDEFIKIEERILVLDYWIELIFIRIKDNKLIIEAAKAPVIKKLIKKWETHKVKMRTPTEYLTFFKNFKKDNFKILN